MSVCVSLCCVRAWVCEIRLEPLSLRRSHVNREQRKLWYAQYFGGRCVAPAYSAFCFSEEALTLISACARMHVRFLCRTHLFLFYIWIKYVYVSDFYTDEVRLIYSIST